MVPHPTAPIIIYPSVSVVSDDHTCFWGGRDQDTGTALTPAIVLAESSPTTLEERS